MYCNLHLRLTVYFDYFSQDLNIIILCKGVYVTIKSIILVFNLIILCKGVYVTIESIILVFNLTAFPVE